jgi:hypothetical protein
MNARLAAASLWLPPWTVRRELERVAAATTSVLDSLLDQHLPGALEAIRRDELPQRGSLPRRRDALAAAHTVRVARLAESLGREAGIGEARRALFGAGVALGKEAQQRLKVGHNRHDLLRAARVLYRVLGIRFRAEWKTSDEAIVRIDRCALARGYSPEACLALSATDAGVVAGLWPGVRLEFDERITEGKKACVARLSLPGARSEAAQ